MSSSASSFCRLAATTLSLLALASRLPHASASDAQPLAPAAAAKLLSAVNAVRRQAGAPPVSWSAARAQHVRWSTGWLSSADGRCDPGNANMDPTLYHYARAYTETASTARTYFVSGPGRRAADAVAYWAQERRWYDAAGAKACAAGDWKQKQQYCGNYERVVRPTAKNVGCAVAVCVSGQTLLVCEFYPVRPT